MPNDPATATISVTLGVAASALRLVASVTDEQTLFDGACTLLAQDAGYALVWVGLARDDAERSVEPVAVCGSAKAYVADVRVSWADNASGCGPTGRAIRGGAPMVFNALASDERYGPWREQAKEHGFAASAALPIRDGARVVGALNVYSSVPQAFGAEELALLDDVALALSLGLSRLREHAASVAATQELQLARDNLAAIYDATPDLVFVHGGDGRLLGVNKASERFYGASSEVLCQTLPERLMGEGHTMDEAAHHVRMAFENGAEDFMWVGRKCDGTTFPCEVRLRRLPGERHSIEEPHVVAISRDLTDLVRLQDELVGMQRLESLAVLAGGIAHDFNNQLAGILGNLELSLSRPELTSETRDLLAAATDAASGARGLSRQLLAFARGGDRRRDRFELAPLIQEVVTLLFAGQSVASVVELPDEVIELQGDREQLMQVIGNLLRNALEASPEGGAVRVTAKRLDDAVRVEVSDHGPGVDASAAPHVFDPFFTTKTGGTGLGLSSAFGIARRHGGGLELLSNETPGATFRLTLSVAGAAPSVPSPPQPVAATTRRALVMDDQEGLRRLFARMLERVGFEVVTASDGDAALELCREAHGAGQPIALALLDLTVPGGRGGHEILPELRALDASLRAVAATGYADSDARAADFDAFLPKPFGMRLLETELARLFPDEG